VWGTDPDGHSEPKSGKSLRRDIKMGALSVCQRGRSPRSPSLLLFSVKTQNDDRACLIFFSFAKNKIPRSCSPPKNGEGVHQHWNAFFEQGWAHIGFIQDCIMTKPFQYDPHPYRSPPSHRDLSGLSRKIDDPDPAGGVRSARTEQRRFCCAHTDGGQTLPRGHLPSFIAHRLLVLSSCDE